MTAPHTPQITETADKRPVTVFGPDFPFPFDDWIRHPSGLGRIPAHRHGEEVAIVGAGMSGMVAAYELMKMGLKPVIYVITNVTSISISPSPMSSQRRFFARICACVIFPTVTRI